MKKTQILLAEDSPTQAAQLSHPLEQKDFLVTILINGAQGTVRGSELRALPYRRPDQ